MKYVNICLIVIMTFALSAGTVNQKMPSVGYHPGETIPDIVLTDLEGNNYLLHDYKGKKVVVNFWASYDARSRAANVQLHNILKGMDEDVIFLSVSFDENQHVVERTLRLDDMETVSLFNEPNGTRSKLYKELKLDRGFRNYLIDENGVIAAMDVDPADLKQLL
ncbi:MAG: TlpA disulfide reductase family protein [Bacteroidota bacterium]|jgi:peroxiredoxin|nr:TlpA disulfide reductase family protein [Bacteroidota bacterium]HHU97450.1 TlpA family protein disulfide reductase [Petrimonas sp.]